MIEAEEDLPLLPQDKVSILYNYQMYNFLLGLSVFLAGLHVVVVRVLTSPKKCSIIVSFNALIPILCS